MPRYTPFNSGNNPRFPTARPTQPRGFNLGGVSNPPASFPSAPGRPTFRQQINQGGFKFDSNRQSTQDQQNFAPRYSKPRPPRRSITPKYEQPAQDQRRQPLTDQRRQPRPRPRQGSMQGIRQAYSYNQRTQEDFKGEQNTYRGRERTNAIDVRGKEPLEMKDLYGHFSQYGAITNISMNTGGRSAVVTYSQPVLCEENELGTSYDGQESRWYLRRQSVRDKLSSQRRTEADELEEKRTRYICLYEKATREISGGRGRI